jgi:hypothetical protein
MRRVAVTVALAIGTMMAATLLVHVSRERSAALDQARAQQEELVRHLERIEKTLSVALERDTIAAAEYEEYEMSTSARSVPHDSSTNGAAKADAMSANRAARDEALHEGNAIVDRAIANGFVRGSDFDAFGTATRELGGEERAQIMARLAAALNAERVQVEKPQSPRAGARTN